MNILLIGEFSGLHNCLKQGLLALGAKATLASDGDAWKSFPSDVHFSSPFRSDSAIGRVVKNVRPFFVLPRPEEFDAVQLVSPMVLTPRFGINELFVKRVATRARRLYVLAAGDDCVYFRNLAKFQYNPIDEYRVIDLKGHKTPWDSPRMARFNDWLARRADGVIPVAYEYSVGYRDAPNCRHIIPMPIDLEEYSYAPNRAPNKVVFLHGINRPGFKGSRYILEAFERSASRWAGCAEFRTVSRLPIHEYRDALREANVIVDQALSYSYGMNALIGMAMGRVVMSGAEPEAVRHLERECPVVNIKPDANHIVSCIDDIMDRREELREWGWRSREFVELNHSHIRVAGRFLDSWK